MSDVGVDDRARFVGGMGWLMRRAAILATRRKRRESSRIIRVAKWAVAIAGCDATCGRGPEESPNWKGYGGW